MSRTLKFWGASDDLFEITGSLSGEPAEIDERDVVRVFDKQGNGLQVVANYIDPGVWAIGLAPLDEEQAMPPWPMTWRLEPSRQYSAELTLEAPDDAVMALGTRRGT